LKKKSKQKKTFLRVGFLSTFFEKKVAKKLSGVMGMAVSVYSLSYSLFN
jgi:hypothetical protein